MSFGFTRKIDNLFNKNTQVVIAYVACLLAAFMAVNQVHHFTGWFLFDKPLFWVVYQGHVMALALALSGIWLYDKRI